MIVVVPIIMGMMPCWIEYLTLINSVAKVAFTCLSLFLIIHLLFTRHDIESPGLDLQPSVKIISSLRVEGCPNLQCFMYM